MKKNIKNKIDIYLDWTYGITIQKMRNDLDELEKLGATDIEITSESSYADISIEVFSYTIETDDEYSKRIQREFNLNKDITERELKELERLKLKYNL